jgi:hypothetical protein
VRHQPIDKAASASGKNCSACQSNCTPTNGLTCLVDTFRNSPLSAHITLVRGERSALAETAANLL